MKINPVRNNNKQNSGPKNRRISNGVNPNIFRAYDIRGIYPDDLNEEAAYRIARATAQLSGKAKKIVVAQDPRLSSPSLAEAVIKGLLESGKEVINIGIAPDPLFYFTLFHYGYDGGIMISGSHNPKEYNGMTLNVRRTPNEEPEDIVLQSLQKIKERVISGQESSTSQKKGVARNFNPIPDYINYVTERIHLKKPLKVVIDSANGACGFLPENLFKKLGCQVKTLYGEFDGTFPHHLPDPYEEENLKDIKAAVIQEKADIGFAFDTDGDRVGPIDNRGRRVSGDFCMLMLAKHTLKKKKGPIVHCMRTSKAFLDEMAKEGVPTYFSVSFHAAVRKKIIETNAVFGGEVTYHYFFPIDYYLCDEAVFSALKIAEIASEQDDFAAYIDTLPRYFASPEVFIDVPDEKKAQLIEKLQKYLRENDYNFLAIDGARVNFPNGWALARMSNTTPFIKCRFEGVTKDDLVEIEKKSLKIFKKVGIPITKKTLQKLALE